LIKEVKVIYQNNFGQKPAAGPQKPSKDNGDLVNDRVRFPEVLLIGPNGEQLGKMSSREAQFKANDFDMDLLCVAPNATPPVCKIVNYGKYKFEQQKKAKEAKKNQKIVEIKEVRLTPQIGLNDMKTKAKAAIGFLQDGNKVKVSLKYKGRQMTHLEVGEETMNNFINLVTDYAIVEKAAAMEGKFLNLTLAPKKK